MLQKRQESCTDHFSFLLHLHPRENTRTPCSLNCLLALAQVTLGRADKSIEEQTQGSQTQLKLSLQLPSAAHWKEGRV